LRRCADALATRAARAFADLPEPVSPEVYFVDAQGIHHVERVLRGNGVWLLPNARLDDALNRAQLRITTSTRPPEPLRGIAPWHRV
jgi:hypothetical protein